MSLIVTFLRASSYTVLYLISAALRRAPREAVACILYPWRTRACAFFGIVCHPVLESSRVQQMKTDRATIIGRGRSVGRGGVSGLRPAAELMMGRACAVLLASARLAVTWSLSMPCSLRRLMTRRRDGSLLALGRNRVGSCSGTRVPSPRAPAPSLRELSTPSGRPLHCALSI